MNNPVSVAQPHLMVVVAQFPGFLEPAWGLVLCHVVPYTQHSKTPAFQTHQRVPFCCIKTSAHMMTQSL